MDNELKFSDLKLGDRILLPKKLLDHWNSTYFTWIRDYGRANEQTPFYVIGLTQRATGRHSIQYHKNEKSPAGPIIEDLRGIRKYVEPKSGVTFLVTYELHENIYNACFRDRSHFAMWQRAVGCKILAIKEVPWVEGEGLMRLLQKHELLASR